MKKIIIFLICFFLFLNSSYALTLTCPKIASPNEKISCKIEDEEYIGLKLNYEFDKYFTYKNFSNSTWKKYYSSNIGFSISNINTPNKLEANLELEIDKNTNLNQEYLIKLTNIEAVDNNYQHIKLKDIDSRIKIVSNINTLKQLEVSKHKLNPSFNSNTTKYKLSTKDNKIIIKAIPTDKEAKVSGDVGEQKLDYGSNIFTINVTSVKGEVKTYYLYVTREIPKNSDITLKTLTISKGKLDFNKNKFLYFVDLENNIDDIEVTAIPTNNKTTVKIDKPKKLSVGKNCITITTTAEDKTTGKYTIIVNRKQKLSNDTTIKSFIIKNYELNFKNDIYEYELAIANENKLDIEIILNNDKAKYIVEGNKNLNNNSIILIKVTAEDGSIKEYKIKIKKTISSPDSSINKEENIKEEIDDYKDNTKENSNNLLDKLSIIPIIVFIILILFILKTIKRKKQI